MFTISKTSLINSVRFSLIKCHYKGKSSFLTASLASVSEFTILAAKSWSSLVKFVISEII